MSSSNTSKEARAACTPSPLLFGTPTKTKQTKARRNQSMKEALEKEDIKEQLRAKVFASFIYILPLHCI